MTKKKITKKITKKKLPKMTKKCIEEVKVAYRKIEIDNKKIILDKAVSTLAKYGLPQYHNTALDYKELADNKLKHLLELGKDDGIGITKLLFSGCGASAEEIHKENLAYYDYLIKLAEHNITQLSTETKKKIIMDGLKNRKQWDFYWAECSKLIAKNKKNKPKKKSK